MFATCLLQVNFVDSDTDPLTQIDIPIFIVGGDSAVITFVGIGYDSRKIEPAMLMGDPASDFVSLPISEQITIEGQVGRKASLAFQINLLLHIVKEFSFKEVKTDLKHVCLRF